MFNRKISLMVMIIASVVVFAGFAGKAAASSSQSVHYTYVYNPGNNPGDRCTNSLYTFDGYNYTLVGFYAGHMVLVLRSNGYNLECHMTLQDGPGVNSTLVLNFPGLHQVYTPGGDAVLNLHA